MTQPAGESSAGVAVTVDALANTLVALYAQAEQDLLTALARVARHGLNDTTATAQLAMLGQMRRTAQRLVTSLALRTGPLTSRVVEQAARDGDAAALRALRAAVAGHQGLARLYLADTGHRIASANMIAIDLASKLDATRAGIVRFADDAYRAAVADTSTRLILSREQLTPTTAQQRAWTELTRRGITGYTDTAGRSWNLSSYVEMATRTTVQRAYNAAHEARMTSVGIEFFTISHDGRPCPLCKPWEGAILSTGPTGLVSTSHALTGRPTGVRVAGTIEQARAAGLQHPNCKHILLPYFPGVTRTGGTSGWSTADEQRYRATQQLRRMERELRAAKRQQAAALDDLARQRAARRIRAYQARIREHTGRHGLVRRRRREQLDLGNKP